jgi:hypothetical protein
MIYVCRPAQVFPRVLTREGERNEVSTKVKLRLQLRASSSVAEEKAVDVDDLNKKVKATRLEHLEAEAIDALKKTIEKYQRPAFPCALITGDVVWISKLLLAIPRVFVLK